MTQKTNQATETQPEDLVVDDINRFAQLMMQWFNIRTNQIKKLLTVPAGAGFEVGGEDILLEGDTLKGFKFGVEMALMQLGTLPFTPHYEDAPAANEAAPQTSPVSNG